MKLCYIFVVFNLISLNSASTNNTEKLRTWQSPIRQASGLRKNDSIQTSDLLENNVKNKGENEIFWVLRNDNSSETSVAPERKDVTESDATDKTDIIPEYTTKVSGVEKQGVWLDENDMNEQIFLARNNCNIELQINESEDRKLKIEYDNLGRNMSGECQTTLYGKGGILLALLVTNVQFSENRRNNSNEILRVISRNQNFNFTLIEYHGNDQYYPVILTDSDKAFLVLYFNETISTSTRSGFNLEVFNYYKNENPIHFAVQDDKSYGYSGKDVEKIFITTKSP